MPVSVVIGGQYGSEGKGKTAHYFAKKQNAAAVVRVGGSNSGHTVIGEQNREWIFRHLPTAALLDDVTCVIPAGAYIDGDVLVEEIYKVGLSQDRLLIDPNAVLITKKDIAQEESGSLKKEIGSTQSGTGAAVIKRIERKKDLQFVSSDERLSQYVKETKPYLRKLLSEGKRIIVEGTQGYGLSVLHSGHYPYTTSRDTTAAGFVSEAGVSPLDVDDIIMVLRAFPIRVGGNSGPLKNETDWETVQAISGKSNSIKEYTTVTNRLRRVGHFNSELVKRAIEVNCPTKIVLNHIDYLDARCEVDCSITEKAEEFIISVEKQLGRDIDYVGISPKEILINKKENKENPRRLPDIITP